MGRSNCVESPASRRDTIYDNPDIPMNHQMMIPIENSETEIYDFFCGVENEPYVTTEGWFSLLQMYATAAEIPEGTKPTWELLWLYVPDYTRNGRMGEIEHIPYLQD